MERLREERTRPEEREPERPTGQTSDTDRRIAGLMIDGRRETIDGKREMGDGRTETEDGRETRDGRRRQETGDERRRREAGDERDRNGDGRETEVFKRDC